MQVTTIEIKSVDVNNLQDVEMVKSALSCSPGIGNVEVDFSHHRIIVHTANQDHGTDALRRLEEAGFKLSQVLVL